MPRTSESHPIDVAFVDEHLLPPGGRLGLTFAPGKKQAHPSSGAAWDRDLAADLRRLRLEFHADVLVSLTETHEHRALGIPDLGSATRDAGMEHVHFPIPDVSVPADESSFRALITQIIDELERSRAVVVHCMGGLGRSGTVAAAVLVTLGERPDVAIERVRAARPGALETPEQERWIEERVRVLDASGRRDKIVGCLLGGAVGDALGAGIEFHQLDGIRERFGPSGIDDYVHIYGREGAITDDTQMTLFTAEGLLRAIVRGRERSVGRPTPIVRHAYLRWLTTQGSSAPPIDELRRDSSTWPDGWLVGVEELHSRRAPGNTCLSSLRTSTSETAENDSKGCGGIMRSAPFGLLGDAYDRDIFELAGECSHITHGHETEHLSSGVFADLIRSVVGGQELPEAVATVRKRRDPRLNGEVRNALDAALRAFAAGDTSPEAVERLGGGWVSEEALSIGLFAALYGTAQRDFRAGVLLAVNHSGDSDSTGSIAGNLMGAAMGVNAIPGGWLDRLELRDVIETVARDLWAAGEHRELLWEKYPGW